MQQSTLFGLDALQVWDTERAFQNLQSQGQADTKRTAERRLHSLRILPAELTAATLLDEHGRKAKAAVVNFQIEQARSRRKLVLFAQLHALPNGRDCLHANDGRGTRYWIPFEWTRTQPGDGFVHTLKQLQAHIGKELVVLPHGLLVELCRKLKSLPFISLLAYAPVLDQGAPIQQAKLIRTSAPHLQRLESESIYILREAVAEAENPVLLYSGGKDSTVMLHLARKAFYPAVPPFALLHVDTRWKFQDVYLFRDQVARESGMDLLVHINPDAVAKDINPFDHRSTLRTGITETEGLNQALNKYKFDVILGGARRDEEKSRAKERIFSFRTASNQWDPKSQRPELWNLYNTRKNPGESIRVFPLSNWTELDIWQYIHQENILVVPLYFAKERPVVIRDGLILLVDDDRMRLLPGESIQAKKIRFRTLGCYPLTGAIESEAETLPDIILELIHTASSERKGRVIDADAASSMEKKKQEGYF